MTFEERLAELGVDPAIISLRDDRCDALYERFYKASEAIAQELGIGFSALTMITLLLREIAERDDIIDRMETRIVNLTGEREYLLRLNGYDCKECKRYDECIGCDRDLVEDWAGVPEAVVADDAETP